jgi:hypothetical protein
MRLRLIVDLAEEDARRRESSPRNGPGIRQRKCGTEDVAGTVLVDSCSQISCVFSHCHHNDSSLDNLPVATQLYPRWFGDFRRPSADHAHSPRRAHPQSRKPESRRPDAGGLVSRRSKQRTLSKRPSSCLLTCRAERPEPLHERPDPTHANGTSSFPAKARILNSRGALGKIELTSQHERACHRRRCGHE